MVRTLSGTTARVNLTSPVDSAGRPGFLSNNSELFRLSPISIVTDFHHHRCPLSPISTYGPTAAPIMGSRVL
jgi:hypothetical protein